MFAVIKSVEQHQSVLRRIDELMSLDEELTEEQNNELEILAVLVRDYEHRVLPLPDPDPITAIRVAADQRGLAARDLVPFLGTRSRVSEVLSGKRPLSLSMIRALHAGLGIPLESLIAEPQALDEYPTDLEWDRFPVREMARRGWLNVSNSGARARWTLDACRDALAEFLGTPDRLATCLGSLQKTDRIRGGTRLDPYALTAWTAYVLRRAERTDIAQRFDAEAWGEETFHDLRSLSRFDVGPRLAIQFLEDRGIIVDIVPHLPKTRLDGAAMLRSDGTPIIALTIRHDRLDNFWFTLFHELMHVIHHLSTDNESRLSTGVFLDDLDVTVAISDVEAEADNLAREALIPPRHWEHSAVRYVVAPLTVQELARQASVSDAIVAGRVRFERRNYRLLSQMIGAGRVRGLFPEVDWQFVER
jgi:HTH-type transcriptional regulator/antitoxin HigA